MKTRSRFYDKLSTATIIFLSVIVVILLVYLIATIMFRGVKIIDLEFLFSNPSYGSKKVVIAPQIFNSLYILIISMIITVPSGIAAGIYMAEYAKPGKLTSTIRFCIESLASIPSIVIGLFGLLVFVKVFGFGFSIISGALALSILNLPIMTRITEDAIKNVPASLKAASLALGATKWQTIIKVVIPYCISVIITGVILVAGRVFGEAATLIYTSGMSASKIDLLNFDITSIKSPYNIFRPAETLSVFIWKINSEAVLPNFEEVSNGASAVLIGFVLLFNIFSRLVGGALSNKFLGKQK